MNLFTTRRTLGWFLLQEAGPDGGAGGGGSVEPETTADPTQPDGGAESGAPAPQDRETSGDHEKPAEDTEQTHRSAFAKFSEKAKGVDGNPEDNQKVEEPGKSEAVDLSSMSDEDWAKAVQPAGEDGTEPDRSFMLAMAKVSRENGVTPEVMRKLVSRYAELEQKKASEADAALRKDQDAMAAEAEAAFDDNAMQDIMAASSKYINPNGMLAQAMRDTVLGSNLELLNILKILGGTLRSDSLPIAAAAGSSQSADHRLFIRTVPERLR